MATRPLTVNNIRTRYKLSYDAILAAQAWVGLARKVESDQPDGENYGTTGGIKGMSEKHGEDTRETVVSSSYHLNNRDFHSGFTVKGRNWRFNKTGDTWDNVDKLALNAAAHPGDLLQELIVAGDSTLGPDGENFFDTDHPTTSGTTMSNDLSGGVYNVSSTTVVTANEWANILFDMATAMQFFTDDAGIKVNLGVKDFTVSVTKVLYPSLLKALAQNFIGSGESNPIAAVGQWTFSPQLLTSSSATDTYVTMTANNRSAYVYQELENPSALIILGEDSEQYKKQDILEFTARGTYNVGFDRWQGACLATLS